MVAILTADLFSIGLAAVLILICVDLITEEPGHPAGHPASTTWRFSSARP
jgi:hypothetical protein